LNHNRRMDASIALEAVTSLDERIIPLAADARSEGYGFVDRMIGAWHSGEDRFSRAGEALLMARADDEIVGVCGLNIDPYAHDPATGRLRCLYVRPRFRCRGVADLLVSRLIAGSPQTFQRVRLRTYNPVAVRFYAARGFRACSEADASHVMDLR
jgi:GNAT superfamily N-acetyltransferase